MDLNIHLIKSFQSNPKRKFSVCYKWQIIHCELHIHFVRIKQSGIMTSFVCFFFHASRMARAQQEFCVVGPWLKEVKDELRLCPAMAFCYYFKPSILQCLELEHKPIQILLWLSILGFEISSQSLWMRIMWDMTCSSVKHIFLQFKRVVY